MKVQVAAANHMCNPRACGADIVQAPRPLSSSFNDDGGRFWQFSPKLPRKANAPAVNLRGSCEHNHVVTATRKVCHRDALFCKGKHNLWHGADLVFSAVAMAKLPRRALPPCVEQSPAAQHGRVCHGTCTSSHWFWFARHGLYFSWKHGIVGVAMT